MPPLRGDDGVLLISRSTLCTGISVDAPCFTAAYAAAIDFSRLLGKKIVISLRVIRQRQDESISIGRHYKIKFLAYINMMPFSYESASRWRPVVSIVVAPRECRRRHALLQFAAYL